MWFNKYIFTPSLPSWLQHHCLGFGCTAKTRWEAWWDGMEVTSCHPLPAREDHSATHGPASPLEEGGKNKSLPTSKFHLFVGPRLLFAEKKLSLRFRFIFFLQTFFYIYMYVCMHRHALKYTPNIMFRGLITGSQTSCLSVLAYLWVAGGDRSAPQETGQEGSKVTFSNVCPSQRQRNQKGWRQPHAHKSALMQLLQVQTKRGNKCFCFICTIYTYGHAHTGHHRDGWIGTAVVPEPSLLSVLLRAHAMWFCCMGLKH